MAIKPLKLGQVRNFICESDKDSLDPTIFKLGVLPSRVISHIRDNAFRMVTSPTQAKTSGEYVTEMRQHQLLLDYVKYGLKDVENFVDESGSSVKISFEKRNIGGVSYDVVSENFIALLPFNVIDEIAGALLEDNSVSEQERKN